ncbi:GNAT family N-acetyltransferase [Klugiella xanthotipulae]|uniref:RimJ/RimL family protein N-acetyltransferase n=1 Tax=Klugiella xanthotipulae TaxID=244735 RepID=A0A543I5L0_9MICO|nr:GNAT family N-acetyltransferase [Klugiella xanthotipulae]TQM65892.1 RimJ/RimL family protein N-acetyltransferase [Klugiella xanthotipulae]
MHPVPLTTSRLLLNQPTTRDVDRIADYCTEPLFERFMATPWPYRRSDAEFFVHTVAPIGWSTETEATWAMRARSGPDTLLGLVSIRADSGEVGYWLGAPHRGHGYTVEALHRVVGWALDTTFGGVAEAHWSCTVGNVASAAVARAAGFHYVGTGPSIIPDRAGGHPNAWHGVYRAADGTATWPPHTRAIET